jgi:hypothetical protein
MRRPLAALPLALAALAFAGCTAANTSSGDFEGEQKNVADVVDTLGSAAGAADGDKICTEVLAKALADKMAASGSTCAQQLDDALADADDSDLSVESVTVDGATATAKVKGRDGADKDAVRTFEFERSGQDWRISSFGDS